MISTKMMQVKETSNLQVKELFRNQTKNWLYSVTWAIFRVCLNKLMKRNLIRPLICDKNVENENGDKNTFAFPMMNCIFLKEVCRIGYLIQIKIPRNTKSTKIMPKTLVTIKPTENCFTCRNNATDFFRKNRKIFPLQSVRTGMTNQFCGPERLIPFTFWRSCLWKKNKKIWVCWDCTLAFRNFLAIAISLSGSMIWFPLK